MQRKCISCQVWYFLHFLRVLHAKCDTLADYSLLFTQSNQWFAQYPKYWSSSLPIWHWHKFPSCCMHFMHISVWRIRLMCHDIFFCNYILCIESLLVILTRRFSYLSYISSAHCHRSHHHVKRSPDLATATAAKSTNVSVGTICDVGAAKSNPIRKWKCDLDSNEGSRWANFTW